MRPITLVVLVCLVGATTFVLADAPRYRDGVRTDKQENSAGNVNDFIQETINNNHIVVFSKSYCP